jgi:uncharacterized membrane protein
VIGLTKLINDVYQGIYYHALKYETEETAFSRLRLRMIMVFFLYYMGLLILLIAARVKLYGPFKPSLLEDILAIFGVYLIVYRLFIHPRILKLPFDHSMEERKRKIKIRHLVFAGSMFTFFICFAIVGLLYSR